MSGVHFYKKGIIPPKNDEGIRYTFPAISAQIDSETMHRFKMEPSLKRFATALIKQTENEEVVGIKITDIDFIYILKSKEEK